MSFMRQEIVHGVRDANGDALAAERTFDEPWYDTRERAELEGHRYAVLADYALSWLRGTGECLVVGSPLFEALELERIGWRVTYLDVRKPPIALRWVDGDATRMPFQADYFDAASSNCVLCHAGLGRYGDKVNPVGDISMMREIKRVLKPGARCAITAGPAAEDGFTQRMGTMHRVYLPDDLIAMMKAAGFEILDISIWDTAKGRWREKGEKAVGDVLRPDYISFVLRKPES